MLVLCITVKLFRRVDNEAPFSLPLGWDAVQKDQRLVVFWPLILFYLLNPIREIIVKTNPASHVVTRSSKRRFPYCHCPISDF